MNKPNINDILVLATLLVRDGDSSKGGLLTETTTVDSGLLRCLEEALLDVFEVDSEHITYDNISTLLERISTSNEEFTDK